MYRYRYCTVHDDRFFLGGHFYLFLKYSMHTCMYICMYLCMYVCLDTHVMFAYVVYTHIHVMYMGHTLLFYF